MLGLFSKDFKAAIKKMLPQQLQILLKQIKKKKKEKGRRSLSEEI